MSEKPIEQKPIPTKTPDKGHPEGEKKLPVANGAENVGLKEKHYRESRKKLATLQSEADKEAAKKSLKTSQGGQDLGPGKAPPENTKTQQGEPEKAQTELQTAEKETIKAFHEKHEAETKLIAEYKTLEGLDPEAKKAAEKAIQTEYLRKSLSTIPLDHPVIKGLEEEAKKINPDYDKLTGEQKYEICMRTPGAKDKIAGYLADYSKLEPAELNDAKIQELTKKHFGIESLSGEKLGVFKLPQSADALKEQRFVDAANRGLNEKNLEELAKLRGDSLEWNDIPDSMKTAINFDPYFTMDESKLPIKFREEAQEMKAQAREERRPNETAEQYAERIKTTTGANPQQATEMMIQSGGSRYNMSRLGRAIADLFAPIFASLPDPTGAMWRNYMKNNAFFTSGTLAEREAKNGYGGGGGVGGGGEVQGSMPGYSLDVNGEITESEKQTIKTIHEAFKTKVTDVAMQAKLLAMLERHAKNNPNFRADQPFLAHDVGTKKAFVFFPPGEAVVCGATHGYAGVGNV
ncbi:hypothetical protein KA050_04055, partial [Candidatus Gracilibacteria bacterium]|nr:hypothetical protein [Candidatus Gracilibacteria bacterium]